MKRQIALALKLALIGIAATSSVTAQNASTQLQTKPRKAKPDKTERQSVRREFEAIFAKQIADYEAQFEAVKKGEKLKPTCAPGSVLFKRLDGTPVTCEQVTADKQAKFERIKRINFLKIDIGVIEITGNAAVVFTTQHFSRVVPDENGRDHTVVTDGTVHKEFWVRTEKGWEGRGFEEVKQGKVTVK